MEYVETVVPCRYQPGEHGGKLYFEIDGRGIFNVSIVSLSGANVAVKKKNGSTYAPGNVIPNDTPLSKVLAEVSNDGKTPLKLSFSGHEYMTSLEVTRKSSAASLDADHRPIRPVLGMRISRAFISLD